jgi:glutamate carboxypeptidase
MVLIQSGSRNKAGVNSVAESIAEIVSQLGLALTTIPLEDYGKMLVAATPSAHENDAILLIGHMDTVFPADTDFKWFCQDDEKIYGPGVADMKGGLVVGLWTLKTLTNADELKSIPLRFIFNPDEEVGSPVSSPIISSEARRSVAAFVLECGGSNGGVVSERKGRIGVHIETLSNRLKEPVPSSDWFRTRLLFWALILSSNFAKGAPMPISLPRRGHRSSTAWGPAVIRTTAIGNLSSNRAL